MHKLSKKYRKNAYNDIISTPTCRYIVLDIPIYSSFGHNYFLSNMWTCLVLWQNMSLPSVVRCKQYILIGRTTCFNPVL